MTAKVRRFLSLLICNSAGSSKPAKYPHTLLILRILRSVPPCGSSRQNAQGIGIEKSSEWAANQPKPWRIALPTSNSHQSVDFGLDTFGQKSAGGRSVHGGFSAVSLRSRPYRQSLDFTRPNSYDSGNVEVREFTFNRCPIPSRGPQQQVFVAGAVDRPDR